jgi:hypothetical protein
MAVKYPNVHVQLTGQDGNAFAVLGRCTAAAKKHKVSSEECEAFVGEATSGDYNHLLATAMKWFNVS